MGPKDLTKPPLVENIIDGARKVIIRSQNLSNDQLAFFGFIGYVGFLIYLTRIR